MPPPAPRGHDHPFASPLVGPGHRSSGEESGGLFGDRLDEKVGLGLASVIAGSPVFGVSLE
jgi:hypothetical protein